MFENKILWWGYQHTESNEILIKRYINSRDLDEAEESDFVGIMYGPYEANNREEALDIFKKKFNLK